jgi:hypothetical protein
MGTTHVAVATVTEDGQLRLDERLDLPPGRVRVRIEPLTTPLVVRPHVLDVVASNGPGRSKEEIDAQVTALRNEWPE